MLMFLKIKIGKEKNKYKAAGNIKNSTKTQQILTDVS